jgi:hypothetical protein
MPKFDLGRVVATPGALRAIRSSGQSPNDFLRRHINGDWGERIDGHDYKQNQIALREGGRLMSAYQTRKGRDAKLSFEAFADALQCGRGCARLSIVLPHEEIRAHRYRSVFCSANQLR